MARTRAEVVARYERELARIIAQSERIQVRDLRRIVRVFRAFSREALLAIASGRGHSLTRAIGATTVQALAGAVDDLTEELVGTIRAGASEQAGLAARMLREFGAAFSVTPVSLAGATVQTMDMVSRFSGDLIGLRQGGISGRLLAEVNGVIRRTALGIGSEAAFDATTEIMRIFRGDRLRRHRHAAERIYRTETLRVHSLLTEHGIRDLDSRFPTDKSWRWSRISRAEHARIDGQTVSASGRFKVPLRSGGTTRMLFPRDPSAPAEATINCGCFVVPVPRASAIVSAA